MDLNQIITLVQAVSDSNLTGFFLEEGNFRLKLEKGKSEESKKEEATIQLTIDNDSLPKTEASRKGKTVVSPLVGTFYTAASPESEPFVKVGDIVKKGQVLGMVEAMKLMNEIEAEQDGILEAILAENEQTVEYGQPLFSILDMQK